MYCILVLLSHWWCPSDRNENQVIRHKSFSQSLKLRGKLSFLHDLITTWAKVVFHSWERANTTRKEQGLKEGRI